MPSGPFTTSGQRAGKEGPTNTPRTEIVDTSSVAARSDPVRARGVGVPNKGTISYGLAFDLPPSLAGVVCACERNQYRPGCWLAAGPILSALTCHDLDPAFGRGFLCQLTIMMQALIL
jgi:hypothetical protein